MWEISVSDELAVSIVMVKVSRAGCGPTRVDMKLVGLQTPGKGEKSDIDQLENREYRI